MVLFKVCGNVRHISCTSMNHDSIAIFFTNDTTKYNTFLVFAPVSFLSLSRFFYVTHLHFNIKGTILGS